LLALRVGMMRLSTTADHDHHKHMVPGMLLDMVSERRPLRVGVTDLCPLISVLCPPIFDP